MVVQLDSHKIAPLRTVKQRSTRYHYLALSSKLITWIVRLRISDCKATGQDKDRAAETGASLARQSLCESCALQMRGMTGRACLPQAHPPPYVALFDQIAAERKD